MSAAGLFWVLSWVKIEIDDYPQFRDDITIATWPKCRYKIFSIRDFLFSNPRAQVFCRARTAWLLVDAGGKRITSLDRLPRPIPYQDGCSALEALPEKLPPVEAAEPLYEKQVRYTDLDLNQHVNNAKYVEILLDSYSEEFHQLHRLRSLVISFQSESRFGDRLVLSRKIDAEPADRHQLIANEAGSGKTVFQAIAEWQI